MKRIMVTGATGFVGRHTLAPLMARGYEVHGVYSRQSETGRDGIVWHQANLLDHEAVAGVVDEVRPTHLLHLAWCTNPGDYVSSPENSRWRDASVFLLRHFQDCGGRRVVIAGTCLEYDPSHVVCCETTTPCRPTSVYAKCKYDLQEAMDALCEEVDLRVCPKRGTGTLDLVSALDMNHNMREPVPVSGQPLSGAWARLFFLYGPGEHPARLVSSVITALLRGETASCNHGQLARDYLYVEDAAEALAALVDSAVQGPVNIGSGKPTPLRDLVLAAAGKLGARDRVRISTQPACAGEPLTFFADTERLRTEVGFCPRYGLPAGMATTVAWWKTRLSDARDLSGHVMHAEPVCTKTPQSRAFAFLQGPLCPMQHRSDSPGAKHPLRNAVERRV